MPGRRHDLTTPTSFGQGRMRVQVQPATCTFGRMTGFSFTCHCDNTGMEWTPNKSQHTKFTQEKKILPPLLPGFELITFRSRVRCSNQQAIPVPVFYDKAFNLSLFCVFIRYRVGGLHPQSDMVVVVVVVVVWWLFPSLRGFWENGGRMLYHSFPACSFLFSFFLWRSAGTQ